MHHRYPWNTPMIVPFLTPQFWASTRFLSYLCKICILASLQIKVLAFILYYKIPFSFFFLPSKSCYRSDRWQDLISHGPCLCIGFKLSSCQSGHSLQEPGRKMHKIKTYQSLNITGKKVSIHQLPTDYQTLTIAISPAPIPIRGLTAMTTRVSFHPPMNPTMKPKTNVEILSINIDTWSAMALLILLISL